MRKMLAGIVLTLLLQGTAHNAFAYYTLSLGNPGLWPDGQMEYTVWSHWDVNDPRPFPCGPKPTGNPSISCQLTVVFYSPQGKKIPTVIRASTTTPPGSNNKTYGDYAKKINESRTPLRSSYPSNLWEPGMCAKFNMNDILVEGNCAQVPPPGGICELKPLLISLAHNTVYSDAIDGNKAVQNATLECQGIPLNVHIKVFDPMSRTSEVKLRPDGSLLSTLSVNGKDGATGIRLPRATGTYTLEISSTLRSVGEPETGAFSGNAIAVIEYF